MKLFIIKKVIRLLSAAVSKAEASGEDDVKLLAIKEGMSEQDVSELGQAINDEEV